MYADHDIDPSRRVAAGAATVAVHALLAGVLIYGLAVAPGEPALPEASLTTLDLTPPPEPPPPPPPQQQDSAAPEAAAPEGRKGEALPVEAPKAPIVIAPVPAAPKAGDGHDTSDGAGAAGGGQGAGGTGSGTGGGGQGAGSPAQRIAGAIRDRDYPREAEALGLTGVVGISFRVRTDGRVDRCTVARSSGHAVLDGLTCRLFTERFRFRPATNGAGQAIESTLQTSFTWGVRGR